MKTVAVTVAVLALGLAACTKNADNNVATETNVENAAVVDTNAATNDVTTNADVALNTTDSNTADNAASNSTTNSY